MTESLLQRVAAGQTDAVAACVDRFGGLIWTLARRLIGRPAEAEDAVQEVFIELWKNASRFDPSVASETTFVAMIARRRLIDFRRRSDRRLEGTSAPIEEFPIQAPEEGDWAEIRDEAAQAADVMKRLKPEQQRVLQLAVCQGWPHQVVAERLGMPLGTVKTHVRRGLIRIREELDALRADAGRGAVE